MRLAWQISVLLGLGSLLSCSSAPEPSDIEGSWRLHSWEAIRVDGQSFYPYGEHAQGMLIYHPDGGMAMSLEKPDRPKLGTDDYALLPDSLLAAAYKGFFSYSGRYELRGDSVLQEIMHCKQPDWRGQTIGRRFRRDGDTLVLFTNKVIGADHELKWLKVE